MKFARQSWLFLLVVMGTSCSFSVLFAVSSPQAYACDGFFGRFDPTCDRRPKPRVIQSGDIFFPEAPKGFIRNRLAGKCIDVAGAPSNRNGARLQLWNCEVSGDIISKSMKRYRGISLNSFLENV